MLRNYRWMALAVLIAGIGCNKWPEPHITISGEDGTGGGRPNLTLPFPSGKYWAMTQGYQTGSHQNWGFDYGDDRYALDFSLSGCEAYGEPVTPMYAGTVKLVTEDGYGDNGYGNSVVIDHGHGYVSRYAHFSENLVEVGDEVDTYDFIGKVGNSGYSLGTVCEEYPGTHLHVAFYWYGDAIEPEPISGLTDLTTGCWYNRQGEENCDSDPNNYEDEETALNFGVAYMGISPEEGNASETEFVWSTVVVSPDTKPSVELMIRNPNDGIAYDFTMSTKSERSPWVYTYRKTLQDAMSNYSYWITVSDGSYVDTSELQYIYVGAPSNYKPVFYTYTWSPDEGEADETEFEWYASFVADYNPEAVLHIVNANDATVYDFPMDMDGSGWWWRATYEKTLRDPAIYPFWVTVENGVSANSTEVGYIEVSE